jgi:hypothetical protein
LEKFRLLNENLALNWKLTGQRITKYSVQTMILCCCGVVVKRGNESGTSWIGIDVALGLDQKNIRRVRRTDHDENGEQAIE